MDKLGASVPQVERMAANSENSMRSRADAPLFRQAEVVSYTRPEGDLGEEAFVDITVPLGLSQPKI